MLFSMIAQPVNEGQSVTLERLEVRLAAVGTLDISGYLAVGDDNHGSLVVFERRGRQSPVAMGQRFVDVSGAAGCDAGDVKVLRLARGMGKAPW